MGVSMGFSMFSLFLWAFAFVFEFFLCLHGVPWYFFVGVSIFSV